MLAILVAALFWIAPPAEEASPSEGPTPTERAAEAFEMATKVSGDSITGRLNDDEAQFDIRSEKGIGEGKIERKGDAWPKKVVLRIHLKGLEYFRIVSAADELTMSISPGNNDKPLVELKQNVGMRTIDSKSLYWPKIEIVSPVKNGDLARGRFEIEVPAKLLEGNPKRLTLDWIDFYR